MNKQGITRNNIIFNNKLYISHYPYVCIHKAMFFIDIHYLAMAKVLYLKDGDEFSVALKH